MIDGAKEALSGLPTLVDVSRSTKREPKRWAVAVYDDLSVYYVGYFWTKNGAMNAAVEAVDTVTRIKLP
jgi:hypothetical protein